MGARELKLAARSLERSAATERWPLTGPPCVRIQNPRRVSVLLCHGAAGGEGCTGEGGRATAPAGPRGKKKLLLARFGAARHVRAVRAMATTHAHPPQSRRRCALDMS